MNREIKFRAWDKRENELLKPQTIEFLIVSNLEHRIIKDFELMQYTGLKDKNGVEIYEGDIVRSSTDKISEVVWDNGFCGFSAKAKHIGHIGECSISHPTMNPVEVIGNIHENKDLL